MCIRDRLTIYENTTIDAPATSDVAYTQYAQVTVESGSELIIADGDTFIPDVLGIGTGLQANAGGAGNGLFGTVYADNIENVAGRGGPNFPLGMTVSGVSTFSGNVSIGGTLTYEDVTNIDSIGIVTARNGIDITGGDLNAASNLILKTGGTERVRIQSNGSAQFTPEGSTSNPNLLIETSGDNIRLNSKKDTGNGGLIIVTQNAGTSSERLRISKDGAIGIAGANYGTSGQVLTSGGGSAAPQWTNPAGGAWEYVSGFEDPDSNYVTFTGFTTSYTLYKVVWTGITFCNNSGADDQGYPAIQLQTNNSTWYTGQGYKHGQAWKESNSGSFAYMGGEQTSIRTSSNNSDWSFSGEITIPMYRRTDTSTVATYTYWYGDCFSQVFQSQIFGSSDKADLYGTNQVTGIRLFNGYAGTPPQANANIRYGRLDLYRLKRS